MENMLHVVIDGRMIDEHLHGIARYTYELIKNSVESGEVFYSILVNDIALAKKVFNDIENVEFILMKSKFLSLGEQIELPKIINKFKGKAIFHSPSFVGSPLIKTDMVMTIHDLNHIRFPQFYTPFHKYYYKFIVKSSANKSKRILTVSEFSQKEILQWLNCKDDKVVVTYNGIDSKFSPINDKSKLEGIKKKYELPEKFVLYIGNLKPHKNVETLIKAMQYIEKNDVYLVINGKLNENMNELIHSYNLENKVKFIGFVDDEDLPYLYNLAEVFVFPSLYEGFGLPPLEAMACGCPTIVANTSSLPEVVGSSGLLFSSTNEKELALKISQVIDSQVDKNYIKQYGIDRAKMFNWKKLSEKTIDVYKQYSK